MMSLEKEFHLTSEEAQAFAYAIQEYMYLVGPDPYENYDEIVDAKSGKSASLKAHECATSILNQLEPRQDLSSGVQEDDDGIPF